MTRIASFFSKSESWIHKFQSSSYQRDQDGRSDVSMEKKSGGDPFFFVFCFSFFFFVFLVETKSETMEVNGTRWREFFYWFRFQGLGSFDDGSAGPR